MAYDKEKEKREALDAGYRALQSLRSAQKQLDSAKNWGIWDMIGGGFFSSAIKNSKMEKAKAEMEQARLDLRSFSKELQDVSLTGQLHLETGDFLTFADLFFDNFFVDWMVQERIHTARKQVDEAIRRVEAALEQLRQV